MECTHLREEKNRKHPNLLGTKEIKSRKEKAIAKGQSFYHGNPCKKGHTKRYISKNACIVCVNKGKRDRRKTDEVYNLRERVSNLIRMSFIRGDEVKRSKSLTILGIESFSQFMNHIEAKFKDGMSWENRDLWDLDHIVPVSWASTREEVMKLNHYTNFQPMWKVENCSKGNRYAGSYKTSKESY